MSPAEAQTKICPFIKLPEDAVLPIMASTHAKCIADRCMAWHWHCTSEDDQIVFSTTDGYCRLIHEGEV